jgi:hypothetical protein
LTTEKETQGHET